MECFMQDSVESGSLVELALDSGKSYVGLVIDSGIATSNDSDVSVIPLFSGYRSADTHELILTTSYREAIIKAAKDASNQSVPDIEVVLPKSQIVSVKRFNLARRVVSLANG